MNHPVLKDYDNCLRESLTKILNVDLPESSWRQATLRTAEGGLGIRSAGDLALPAFLASATASTDLIKQLLPPSLHDADPDLRSAEASWQEQFGSLPSLAKQSFLDMTASKHRADSLLQEATTQRNRVRLLSLHGTFAGAWLNALPTNRTGFNTRLSNEEIRIAVGVRLGCKITEPHRCNCNMPVDQYGLHGLSCRHAAGRTNRHTEVNNIIKDALREAEVPAILEPNHLCRSDNKRPDGVTVTPFYRGKNAVWDFTCVCPLTSSINTASNSEPGKTAASAEHRKTTKYTELSDYHFVPVAVETLGSFGPEAQRFVRQIGARITASTEDKSATSQLAQRIGIAIQRGNASSIRGTLSAF